MIFCMVGLLFFGVTANVQWVEQSSGTTVRFRGVSAVSANVAWASGANGTYARTIDGGKTWQAAVVPGAEKLDFRDVEAFDANTAYLLSIGPGQASRIYKTTDGGKNWALQFTNQNPKAFFDAIAFWDANNGLAVSDPVDGRFVVIHTSDGGKSWIPVSPEAMPAALEGEGAFAASGTCLITQGKTNAWFVTGGAKTARVFRSVDKGKTWYAANTPIKTGNAASGIFSVAFKDASTGIAVGGDYQKEKEAIDHLAVSHDGGRNWALVKNSGLKEFRSAITWIGTETLVTVGPSGSDMSLNDGVAWNRIGAEGFHAFSFSRRGEVGWAVGEKGRIAKFIGTAK
ncbi:MAG: glycosyl hydrolase [Acidobacteria bacterium]|nr:glycosyl hydrolase [Acidobacteriota bacterium]